MDPQGPHTSRLGKLLIAGGYVTPVQLGEALAQQKTKGGRLGNCLIRLGYLSEEALRSVLSRQLGIDVVDLTAYEVDPEALKLLDRETALQRLVMPLRRTDNVLWVAMSDPNDVVCLDDLRFRTGLRIATLLATESQVRDAIHQYYGSPKEAELKKVYDTLPDLLGELDLQLVSEESKETDDDSLEAQSEDAPIIRLVNYILTDSVNSGASDIHIEPYEKELRVRFRVDGVLKTVMSPSVRLKDALTSRIKIMSRLNISEKRCLRTDASESGPR